MAPEFQPEMSMHGAVVNTQASDTGNKPVTRNQFYAFANQLNTRFNGIEARFIGIDAKFVAIETRFNSMEARFVEMETRFNELDKRINELDEKIVSLRSEIVSFKEEIRLVPIKIAGWVAGTMIGSSGVIFGGIQLLRGLL